jgi:aldehyde:ferredoxin oxidoreductase
MDQEQYGIAGKLLRVNLTDSRVEIQKPDESFYQYTLGGRGIIVNTLLKELPPKIDPLSSQNKIVFATGPLTGQKLIGTGRVSTGSKSPLSCGFGESEASGYWGPELKKAGFDAVIIEGRAEKPVYLKIDNDSVEIRDASNMWGLEVKESTDRIGEDAGKEKYRIAVIGPGGENLVRYANIIAEYSHAFGRGGMGAVMGSKNLKGIAVHGDHSLGAITPQRISELNRKMMGKYKSTAFARYGTGEFMKVFESVGNLAIKNHSGGRFPAVEKIDAVTLVRDFGAGMETCYNCPIRCKKRIKIEEGPYPVESIYGGAEYETLASFGSNLLIDDLPAICKANEMCNRYGIDTISTGGTIAFAMECFEKGILNQQEVDGLELRFGNQAAMLKLVEKIAFRQGIGKLLAEGSKRASEVIGKGSSEFAMQVKGLEIPYHEPRFKQGLGLHYSIHAAGADHCSGVMDDGLAGLLGDWKSLNTSESIPPIEMSPRKARMVYEIGLWKEMANHLGLCIFVPWNFSEIREAVEAVTGWRITSWKLMKGVARGITSMRMFNLREGFTRKDDKLPARFYSSPSEGPLREVRVDPEALQEAQEIYYQMMGWDSNGVPTRGCLVELGLQWAVSPST